MNGATVGLAATAGLQVGSLLREAVFAVLCLIGTCLACALAFEGLVIWDMLRKPKAAFTVTGFEGSEGRASLALIAAMCPCCNGDNGDDCYCPDDCGNPRCQAADPEEARRG